jgi:multidrug efflux pump subunit AcrB
VISPRRGPGPPVGEAASGGPPTDPADLARFKEFRVTSFAVDHFTSVAVLLVIITISGLAAYFATPKESFPEIEVPMIAVNTIYAGVAPADIESLVTRKLEDELSTITDVKELTSSSSEGFSSIVAEFETTVDLDDALQRVREKVDLARPELPGDAEDPQIVEFDVTQVPIVQVNLSGEYDLVRLKEVAEDVQDELEQIPEVLRVDLRGGLEREVRVDVNLPRLQYYGVSLQDVIDAIQRENVTIPGGSIDVGDSKYLVRVDGEFEEPGIIEDLVVTTFDSRPVYVRDVASVDFGFADRENFARLDGTNVVTLDVLKRSGRNVIETSDQVKAVLARLQPTFPPTTRTTTTSDQSRDIRMMVSSLENNIVSGLILIVVVLLFILGLTNSVFVAVSIPGSMLLSFVLLKAVGSTMNMIVLFSLILALGMLVDNAIVVVENIYRYMEQGWERSLAAKKATGEVAMPVIAATATTLAAFAPMLFWPGTTGEFMSYLPQTLIITLSSSLFMALVIIPALCSRFMRLEGSRPSVRLSPLARRIVFAIVALGVIGVGVGNPLTAGLLVATAIGLVTGYSFVLRGLADRFQRRLVPRMQDFYERQLRWALDHRWTVLGGAAAAFILVWPGYIALNATGLGPGVEYFPEDIPPKQVFVDIDLPVGSRVEATNAILARIEEELGDVPGRSDWESVVSIAGGAGGMVATEIMGGQPAPSGPDQGRVTLSYVEFQDREADGFETVAWMQENIGLDLVGADVSVAPLQEGVPGGPPINIEISGEDPALLKQLSDDALVYLRSHPVGTRLVGLESDLNAARPELSVVVDRERAGLYDLSTADVGNVVRAAIQGVEAAKYRTDADEYDIVVRLAPEFRAELDQLGELTVMAEGGRQVPLSSLASWEVGESYGTIRRKDQERMATLSAEVVTGLNSNAVLAEVKEAMSEFEASLPPGYVLAYTGQQEEQAEASAFLTSAFVIAIFLIGFILVSQFNSVVKPVIILTSVVMSTVGVLIGLVVFDMAFGIIMTGVGIISLAGIVVNNAIVLIDYIDVLRDRDGMDRREALVQGGKTRFRPVVLTATTTALGLVPLAVGLNFDFFGLYGSLSPEFYWGGEQAAWWGPMAVAVIAGIIFATFLTLVLVPVMYSMVDDFTTVAGKHLVRRTNGEEVSVASGPDVPIDGPTGIPAPPREPESEPVPVYRSARAGGLEWATE